MSSPSSAGSSPAGSPPPSHQHTQEPQPQQQQLDPDLHQPQPLEDDTLDSSFFPSASHYFTRYTSSNLALALDSKEQLTEADGTPFTRAELEPPRVDWVRERGMYSVFGETWPVEDELARLGDMGVEEMFERDADRSQSLTALLRALLLSYTSLVSSLLAPPPSMAHPSSLLPDGSEPPTEPERLVQHIRLISINMHHLINELRPVQARETLKGMMRAQIDARRRKTAAIKSKCAELNATLSSSQNTLQSALRTGSGSEKSGPIAEEQGVDADAVREGKVASFSSSRARARERLRQLVDGAGASAAEVSI